MPGARHQRHHHPRSRPRCRGVANFIDPPARSGRPSPSCGPTCSRDPPNLDGLPEHRTAPTSSAATTRSMRAAMPGVGLEYRFPFVASLGDIGHAGARADRPDHRPSERDADRPGPERGRAEPRLRRHVAVRVEQVLRLRPRSRAACAPMSACSTPSPATMASTPTCCSGQSFQLAGRNSFRQGDLVNIGLDSGLESARSDYVARLQISPNSRISFVTRGRFDQDNFSLRRFEAERLDGPQSVAADDHLLDLCAIRGASRNSAINHRREGVLAQRARQRDAEAGT